MKGSDQYKERNVLLIFVKNPEAGKVKTRLAKTIGDKEALKIYNKLLHITKMVTEPLKMDRQVWYSEFIDKSDLWIKKNYDKHLQEGDSLGQRMKNAFRKAFNDGKQRVLIIGSDCADLTTDIIRRAYHLLDRQKVVVGPSQDGGYYLLGMSEFYPQLFEQKRWSTPSVYRQTVQQLESEDISYEVLQELNDIDTEADLQQSRLSQLCQ